MYSIISVIQNGMIQYETPHCPLGKIFLGLRVAGLDNFKPLLIYNDYIHSHIYVQVISQLATYCALEQYCKLLTQLCVRLCPTV